MTIACLGWGSLIWDPRDLPINSEWFLDGPRLRVEFVRQSGNGRITLVIERSAPEVQSLWAKMITTDLAIAKTQLMAREGTQNGAHVAIWARGEAAPEAIPGLPEWADAHDIEGVVWTALPSQFGGRPVTPTPEQVIAYLRGLEYGVREEAERYIRHAPRQIATPYRQVIEREMDWTPLP